MTIHIQLQYHSSWGESIQLRIGRRRIPMQYSYGGLWQILLTGRDLKDGDRFTFELVQEGKVTKREWRDHCFRVGSARKNIILRSRWQDRPYASAFYASAFTDVIFRRPDGASFRRPRKEEPGQGNVCLRVAVPQVRSHESLGLVGSGKLGDWRTVHLMSDACAPWWQISLDVAEPMEYKFVIVDTRTLAIRQWEEGPNHFIGEIPPQDTQLLIADLEPRFATEPWRGAGVAVPVFSLRTKDSFGVGDFHDIKRLVDWAVATHQCIIQLLPVNDTTLSHTCLDSYPYNAVSCFALHPQYIYLPDAGVRRDAAYKARQAALEALPAVDYEAVNQAKLELLRKRFKTQKDTASPAYAAFLEESRSWLMPYAVFSVLRDQHGTPDFSRWGAFAAYDAARVEEFAREHPAEVGFYCYLQFLLDRQLKDAVAYAHAHGVAIKGDLPIGVSRVSVDAWQHPELFHLDSQAGAPPDAFATEGQNWGFPTYNWEAMARDGYAWWRARMRLLSRYFDAFRIDHILGFFRIWEIPSRYRSGLMGHFSPALPYASEELRRLGFKPGPANPLFLEDPRRRGYWHPYISARETPAYQQLPEGLRLRFDDLYQDFFWHRHNEFWKEGALRKLPPLLRSTGMLACGEDLGMVPACVGPVMEELNILSLAIQRMPQDMADGFARPDLYPYWCVCATGTHDTSTLRGWWEEDPALTQRFYNQMLGCEGPAPATCEPWVASLIVAQHLRSPALLAILPLQDWLATDAQVRYPGNPADERINIPALPRHYWRYRMHCTLESLVDNAQFNAHIRTLVDASGRNG